MLRAAVDSVCRQTFPDWQLIVVDDASRDGTEEWLGTLSHQRIEVVRLAQHSERSAARNRGLARARGGYVLFLDDDDRLRPGALRRLWRATRRRHDILAAVGASVAMVEGRRVRQRSRGRPLHPWLPLVRAVCTDVSLGWYSLPGQSLFSRQALEEVQGWDEALVGGEDYDLWARLAPLGPVAFVPAVVLERGVPPRPPQPRIGSRAALLYPEEVGPLSARFRRARKLYLEGVHSLDEDPRSALRRMTEAVGTEPSLLLSPLTGPRTVVTMAQALIRSVATVHGHRP